MTEKAERIYPIDIWGVKEITYNKWVNNYQNHISSKEYSNIYNTLFKYFTETFCSNHQDTGLYYVATANIKLPKQISIAIYEKINTKRLLDNNYTHVLSKQKISLKDYEKGILKRRIFYPYNVKKFRNLRFIKQYLLKIKGNLSRRKLGYDEAVTVGFVSELTKLYSDNTNTLSVPINTQKYLFQSKKLKYNYDFSEHIENFIKKLRLEYQFISYEFFNELEYIINNKLIESYDLMMRYYDSFGNISNKKMLLNGLGSPLHLIIANAWRLSGGRTIGFTHGNNYAPLSKKNILAIFAFSPRSIV